MADCARHYLTCFLRAHSCTTQWVDKFSLIRQFRLSKKLLITHKESLNEYKKIWMESDAGVGYCGVVCTITDGRGEVYPVTKKCTGRPYSWFTCQRGS